MSGRAACDAQGGCCLCLAQACEEAKLDELGTGGLNLGQLVKGLVECRQLFQRGIGADGQAVDVQALQAAAVTLRQLAKRSRRPVLTPEQRRERWRLASRLRRARNEQRRELGEGLTLRSPAAAE